MARTIDIKIEKSEWLLEDKTLNKDGYIDIFAICEVSNNKIVYAFDIQIKDEVIQDAARDKRFFEICRFRHNDKEFVGNFIDALHYIKNKWGENE